MTSDVRRWRHVAHGVNSRDLLSTSPRRGTGAYQAQEQAYAALYQSLKAQARTLAFIDTYSVLAVGAVVMLSLTIFLKHNDPHAGASRYGSLKTAKAAHRNDLIRCSLASSAEQNSTEKKQPQEVTPERISRLLSMANEYP